MAAITTSFGAPNIMFGNSGGTPTVSNFSLDASNDQAEWVFQVPDAVTITHVGFRYGVRTGTPPTYIISVQGVTNGVPDGTVKGGGSPASQTFTPPADSTWNGTWQWVALANSYAASRGELLSIVVVYSSGTVDASNFSSFSTRTNFVTANNTLPYAIENAAGSRTFPNAMPIYGYKTSGASYGFPLETHASASFDANDTPDEYALKFTVPSGITTTFSVIGVAFFGSFGITGTTVRFVLYDTDGSTVLQDITWDCDDSGNVNAVRGGIIYFNEASLASLTPGSAYRIALIPQQNTTATQLLIFDMDSNADLSALPGGIDFYLNTRTDQGAWTDDVTVNYRRPAIMPIISDMTSSGSGGGGGGYGGLSRGMNQLGW